MTPAVATLNELLRHYLTASPKEQAVGWGEEDGTTAWLTTAEVADRIRSLALALHRMGVQPGDRVALLSENRWEWMVSDFAIMATGAVNVPIHPGLSASQIGYILNHSGARLALASTAERLEGLMTARRQGAELQGVICFETPQQSDPLVTPLSRAAFAALKQLTPVTISGARSSKASIYHILGPYIVGSPLSRTATVLPSAMAPRIIMLIFSSSLIFSS